MKARIVVLMALVAMMGVGVQAGISAPGDIAGLYLSLDADSLGLADGAAVTSWTDSTSSNVFAGTATYEADYANGHAAVLFNGTSDLLRAGTLTGTAPNVSTLTMFVVGQTLTVTGGDKYMVMSGISANNRLRLLTTYSDWRFRVGGGGNYTTSGDIADTDQHVFTVVSGQDGTNATQLLVDDTLVKDGFHGTTATNVALPALVLGGFQYGDTNTPKQWSNCYIAEVLIYDGALTDADITAVNEYLRVKYFPLPFAHTPSPGNGASSEAIDTDLIWSAPETHIPTDYTLYLRANDPNFVVPGNLIDGVSVTPATPTTTYAPPSLAYDTEYFWRVDDTDGVTLYTGAVWSFTTAPEVPEVTLDPVSQTVESGTDVTFTIEHLRGTSMQWFKDDAAISGATDVSYVVVNAQIADEAYYHCEVYNDAAPAPDADPAAVSTTALLMTERIVAKYEFEGNLDDSNGSVDVYNGVVIDPNTANTSPADVAYGTGIIGGQALALNIGTGDVETGCVAVPGTEDVFDFYPQGLTVSAWIKATAGSSYMNIASKYDSPGYAGWVMNVTGGAGNAVFAIRSITASTDGPVGDDAWHLITATYNSTSTEQKMYVDGLLKATKTGTPNAPGNIQTLKIGAQGYNLALGTITTSFAGLIDDLKIYSYAVDPIDIAVEYTTATGATICIDGVGLEFDIAGPTVDPVTGDPVPDCIVNLYDFAVFVENWMNCREVPTCLP